ncbi:MAG: GNAT family N-acetyltransferase, partial [Acidimicrobiales bacterium]
ADGTPMVAEIGVVASQRGHRYVDDLLAWATQLLARWGAERIIADTDRANTPMRAAFKRSGYRELRWRDDYRWQRER